MDKVTTSTKAMPKPRTARVVYPWDTLKKVGDSFFVRDNNVRERQTKICSAAAQHGERHGREYTTEVGEQSGKKGVFVWLLKVS